MKPPRIHICIVQPVGYVHSLGFLDPARFLRYQFLRLGADVTLAKNRLCHEAVNFVFGAHLGFDAGLRARHTCVFVNLEQLCLGGMKASAAYLDLLRQSAVVDYDAANVGAYTAHADDVPLISFAYAPYLTASPLPLDQRPIDLLFIGSMNERRRSFIEAIESCGRSVVLLDGPLYGPERDDLLGQAKAVVNCHHYESARFEQVRAFQCMSLGTPVISERTAMTRPPAQFEDTVFWVTPGDMRDFFARQFGTPEFAQEAWGRLDAFRQFDVVDQYAEVLGFACGYRQVQKQRLSAVPWQPIRLHIGSGKDYKLGWFNIDILESARPDAVLDLAKPQTWPLLLSSDTAGTVELRAGSLSAVFASNVLEHVADLPQLMGNCLSLLAEGGEMFIEVPHERAATAWQDPTHVRAMNKNSWIYYSDWFWYLGWFDWRFQVKHFVYLDARLQECSEDAAHFMRVTLVKIATTLAEKMTARTMQADFGGIPDDLAFDHARPQEALAHSAALSEDSSTQLVIAQ